MKRERSWEEDDDEFSERCQYLIFDKIDLKEEEKYIIQSVLLLNFEKDGWGWGVGKGENWHQNFEKRINSRGDFTDIYSITNYTDALFRFLSHYKFGEYASAKRDLFDKLNKNPFDIKNYGGDKKEYIQRTKKFLNEFINSGNNRTMLNKLVNYNYYEDTTKHSLVFASLIAAATAFKYLSEGDFDTAYNIFRRMNQILGCNRSSDEENKYQDEDEDEAFSSYGGNKSHKTRRLKSRHTRKITRRKTRKKTRPRISRPRK